MSAEHRFPMIDGICLIYSPILILVQMGLSKIQELYSIIMKNSSKELIYSFIRIKFGLFLNTNNSSALIKFV